VEAQFGGYRLLDCYMRNACGVLDMNRDAMIEAMAQAISATILGKTATHGGRDAAAAVLDLCGPETLVWADAMDGIPAWSCTNTIGNQYRIAVDTKTKEIGVLIDGEWHWHNLFSEAAAAAQSHADAAWWSQSKLADMIGGK
jgi:hypothetical protein